MTNSNAAETGSPGPGPASLLPFLAPGVVVAGLAAFRIIFEPAGGTLAAKLGLVFGALWVVLALAVPGLRRFLSDLGEWLYPIGTGAAEPFEGERP